MPTRHINQVLVTDRAAWSKWPHTTDTAYPPVGSITEQTVAQHGDIRYEVETTVLPAYQAYDAVGYRWRHPAFPNIDNTIQPLVDVLARQVELLERLAETHEVLLWDHAVQCFPPVAQHLKRLFKCAILQFADDCPGSSEIKTFPVAQFFHAYYHCMGVWSFEGGQDVAEIYRAKGVERCYFKANNVTLGLDRRLKEAAFDVDSKAAAIACGQFPPTDLVYVGGNCGNHWRRTLLQQAQNPVQDLQTKFYGVGCRDGVLAPREPVERISEPLVAVYRDALFGVNPQQSSLFNTRLMDLWMSGVAQLIYDPHHELRPQGFFPYDHYIPFNGSAHDMYTQVRGWKGRPKDLADLIRRAHRAATYYTSERNAGHRVFGRIYHDYEVGREVG